MKTFKQFQEDIVSLDELSKNTLRAYASKASDQLRHAAYSVGNADAHSQNYYKKGDKLGSPSGNDSLDSSNRKYTKRASGVATAFGKLTK